GQPEDADAGGNQGEAALLAGHCLLVLVMVAWRPSVGSRARCRRRRTRRLPALAPSRGAATPAPHHIALAVQEPPPRPQATMAVRRRRIPGARPSRPASAAKEARDRDFWNRGNTRPNV